LIGISVDPPASSRDLWEKLGKKFPLLSDPGARVIRLYGVVHEGGNGEDISLDTTLFIDEHGIERWRHVSRTLPDLPSAAETLTHIRQTVPAQPATRPARGKTR
jgi:peroxiredoxin